MRREKQRIVYTKRIGKSYINDIDDSLESVFHFLDRTRHEVILSTKILQYTPTTNFSLEYNCEILLVIEGDVKR